MPKILSSIERQVREERRVANKLNLAIKKIADAIDCDGISISDQILLERILKDIEKISSRYHQGI